MENKTLFKDKKQIIKDQEKEIKTFNSDYQEKFGFIDEYTPYYKSPKGINKEMIKKLSIEKDEPEWLYKFRLKALEYFLSKPMPKWGVDLSEIDFKDINSYIKPVEKTANSWDEVPETLKNTFDKLGIPQAEREILAGVSSQYDSEVVYHQVKKELEDKGVIFTDIDTAVKEYPELVKKYLGTVVPSNDNKFSALNSAFFSGGSFIIIPENVDVASPLQTYFRINSSSMLQAERTLIIAEPGSKVSYMEGCHLAGAKIETKEGSKNIEDIKIGDEVLTHKGRFKKVTKLWKKDYKNEIYNIKIKNQHQELCITKQHPLLVLRDNKLQWFEAQNLILSDYLVYPKTDLTEKDKEDVNKQDSYKENINEKELHKENRIQFSHKYLNEENNINYQNKYNPILDNLEKEDYYHYKISKIVSHYKEVEVYNLSVEEDESYISNQIVSHNCSAPSYSTIDSIHAAVVELIAFDNAEITYYTAQNWDPKTIYNLVTKRAKAYNNATVRWIQVEMGSKINMKYPSVYLLGDNSHAEIMSVAFAGEGQNQDTGAKVIHIGKNTTSIINSKSISKDGGISSYRGLLEVADSAENASSKVVCDALLLDDKSATNTWPTIRVGNQNVNLSHEATVSKIGEEQLFYLMSHGISEQDANELIVNGFIEPVVKEMPLEYAVEMNRLMAMQLEGSVG